jgi:Ni2+-binding GTPase involved in maturation of urease and hydrogenase
MVGGFLGAGKTTLLARLARHYAERGHTVALVTNDQADNLVDTNSLRGQGFPVEEVAGACFCCNFNELLAKVGALEGRVQPDVILAEPVGSCTDLVATVVQPLKDLYGTRFQVAPYAVLCKPGHGLRILRGEGGGFSPKAAYVFRKQLEEADAIVINRIDELPPAQVQELAGLIAVQYPGVPVLRLSAKTGLGFCALPQLLDEDGAFGRRILNVDYDVYAEGEAELGWLNSTARVRATRPFPLDDLLREVVTKLGDEFAALGGEIAHLKVIGLNAGGFGVANRVGSREAGELSMPSGLLIHDGAEVIVNARVALDPAVMRERAEAVLAAACRERGAELEFRQTQSLRPGRPVPTHRYAVAMP